MTVLVKCPICDGLYHSMREHCPYCAARRNFNASHSYQPYRVTISQWDEQTQRELVRAIACTFCSDEQQILDAPDEDSE